jgi:hypothetical protein
MMGIIDSNVSLRSRSLASVLAGFNDDDGFHGGNIERIYLSKRSSGLGIEEYIMAFIKYLAKERPNNPDQNHN